MLFITYIAVDIPVSYTSIDSHHDINAPAYKKMGPAEHMPSHAKVIFGYYDFGQLWNLQVRW